MTLAKKPIKITEVVLRDAHQSLLATRMTMDEMRPILPEMDKIPYFSVECWGGATFDSCIRFLDEDPWERLRILRKELPHQKLQMLFRGQNMLGYRPYADDAVEYFVQKSVANGIDVIRIFDALNDPRNLQTAIKAANKEGAHVQACISYTLSPVHNNEYFAKYAKTLEEIPRVREDAGYPPLVTPTSQIVGTQAVFNVIMGERYKMVTKEFKGLVHGDYGKTPAPIKKEFSDFILKGEEPITCRFADTLEPEMDKLKAEAAKYAIQEEDVLTYAMFPQVAPKFFEKRNARLQGVDALHADYENKSHPV